MISAEFEGEGVMMRSPSAHNTEHPRCLYCRGILTLVMVVCILRALWGMASAKQANFARRTLTVNMGRWVGH